ncbi:MAG: Na+/H+ antiporter NhaA, partial [Bacteroidales bacterium]|nr:Na+/H+ antiporter NhaA [Bacteroidales bacterium]
LFAALGGMFVPALIYTSFNFNSGFSSGFGIVMATDIAFAIGVLSLLGKRVPTSLKVFLIALAIFDDLGAILIIAIFYSNGLVISNILIAIGIFLILLFLNYKKVHNLIPYILGGIIMWYFIYSSGIHPTITGVLLAFAIPFRKKKEVSCSRKLELFLHQPVSFFVIPIFALANTAIKVEGDIINTLFQPYSIGIILGLMFGKPLGIWLFSFIGIKLKLCSLPNGLRFKHILSVGMLAGIGFTMSIFITLLAFNDISIQNNAKFAILIASLLAAIIGLISLIVTLREAKSV